MLEALNQDQEAERAFQQAVASGEKQAVLDYEKFKRKRTGPVTVSPANQLSPDGIRSTLPAPGWCS